MARWRLLGTLAMAVSMTSATAACGGCEARGCADGVFLDLSALPAALSAEICINGECTTLPVERTTTVTTDPGQERFVQEVNNLRPLPAGAMVDVSISVFDGSGTLIGHLDDKRSVPNPTLNCTCSELDYSWRGDSLQFG